MPQESTSRQPEDETPTEQSHPEWFRAPTRRERLIAASLFLAFGGFFLALFILQRNWWFRWVILSLGILSILRGLRYAMAREID
jgi:hypothetical protein